MATATIALMTALGASAATAGATAATIGSIGATVSAAMPYIAAGTAAVGGISAGIQANAEGKFQAEQAEKAGDEAFAEGQQRAKLAKRQTDLARSSLRARAAASGGGDAEEIDAGLIEQGDYNQMVEFYQGKSKKSGYYGNAGAARLTGRNALTSGVLRGVTSAYDIVR